MIFKKYAILDVVYIILQTFLQIISFDILIKLIFSN